MAEETEFCKLFTEFHKCGVTGAFPFPNEYKTMIKKFQAQPSKYITV